ncbi:MULTISPECIES: hypothetical protein [Falsihalocynthiibacter]|jgi:hypothetical protein|uniref:hypothetical protein n=1 Tax=Falsihalocynthiibacter TaxID=2854182 RepID=UPI0030014D02
MHHSVSREAFAATAGFAIAYLSFEISQTAVKWYGLQISAEFSNKSEVETEKCQKQDKFLPMPNFSLISKQIRKITTLGGGRF